MAWRNLGGGCGVEVAEAVTHAVGAVEGIGPREIAHIAEDPFGVDGGAAGFVDVLGGEVDAGEAAAAFGELDGVAAVAAGDVEEAGAGCYGEGAFEELDFGGGDFGSHGEAPDIERDAAEKVGLPVGHFRVPLEKTHVG
jgi:hypothetical protein